ncbi:MAG: gliding motility-associated C-terminal domain-containing protein [Bacteroidota bacterium]
MMDKTILILTYVCFSLPLLSQNLIRNHSFEDFECLESSINAFIENKGWYVTGADAYWMHTACPPDPVLAPFIVAMDVDLVPYAGNGYISFEGSLRANGFYTTEGIAQELEHPLKANRYYYVEMGFYNFDTSHFSLMPWRDCDPFPNHYIEVRFANKRIDGSYTSDLSFLPPLLTDLTYEGEVRLYNKEIVDDPLFRNERWRTYWDCFQAEGGEQHISIMGNNYQTDMSNRCLNPTDNAYRYAFGHAIDDIHLIEIPEKIDTLIELCQEAVTVDLEMFIDLPMRKRANFYWNDQTPTTSRQISESGTYLATMELPCVNVPISVRVDKDVCATKVYVPNAFSPNYDGVNDVLLPFVEAQLPISDYAFKVFNRWGALVYQSNDPTLGWDGYIKSQVAVPGLYLWQLQYSLGGAEDLQKSETHSGEVLLMRQ